MNGSRKTQQKQAVSSTVGVILVVAVTVILSASIFMMLSGMGAQTEEPTLAGVQVNENENTGEVEVLIISDTNADKIIIKSGRDTYELSEVGDREIFPPASEDIQIIGETNGVRTLLQNKKLDAITLSNSPLGGTTFVVETDSEWSAGTFSGTKVGSVLLSNTATIETNVQQTDYTTLGDRVQTLDSGSDYIYAGTEGAIYKLAPDGSTQWQSSYGRVDNVRVTGNGQYVYGKIANASSGEFDIIRFNPSDGNENWVANSADVPLSSIEWFTVSETGEVYVTNHTEIVKYDSTGVKQWEYDTGIPDTGSVIQSVDVENDRLYIGRSSNITVLDVSSGSPSTTKSFPTNYIIREIKVHNGAAFAGLGNVSVSNAGLRKYDISSETVEWEYLEPGVEPEELTFDTNKDILYFTDYDTGFYGFDNATGTLEQRKDSSGAGAREAFTLAPSNANVKYTTVDSSFSNILYSAPAEHGSYTSETFTPSTNTRWTQLDIVRSGLSSYDSITFTALGSNDGFATQNVVYRKTFTTNGKTTISEDALGKPSVYGKDSTTAWYNNGLAIANDGTVYKTDESGYLTSYEVADDGTITTNWQYTASWFKDVAIGPNENAYVLDDSGNLLKIDAAGNKVWQMSYLDGGYGGFDVEYHNGYLYVAGSWNSNQIHKIDASDGTEVANTSLPNAHDLDIYNGYVYAVGSSSTGNVTRYDAGTLAKDTAWEFDSKDDTGSTLAMYSIEISSTGDIYVGGGWGPSHLWKLDTNANKVWRTNAPTGMPYSLALDEPTNTVYAVNDGDQTLATNTSNGDTRWDHTNGNYGWVNDVELMDSGRIITTHTDGTVKIIDPGISASDEVKFRIRIDSLDSTDSPSVEYVRIAGKDDTN